MALGLLMMKTRSAHLPIAAGANVIGAIIAWLRDPMWIGGLGVQGAGLACYVRAVARAAGTAGGYGIPGASNRFLSLRVGRDRLQHKRDCDVAELVSCGARYHRDAAVGRAIEHGADRRRDDRIRRTSACRLDARRDASR